MTRKSTRQVCTYFFSFSTDHERELHHTCSAARHPALVQSDERNANEVVQSHRQCATQSPSASPSASPNWGEGGRPPPKRAVCLHPNTLVHKGQNIGRFRGNHSFPLWGVACWSLRIAISLLGMLLRHQQTESASPLRLRDRKRLTRP